jgi:hypothetical protein
LQRAEAAELARRPPKPAWYEHWRAFIRTGEFSVVVGLVLAAISVGGDMFYVVPLLIAATVVSCIAIATEPTLSATRKTIGSVAAPVVFVALGIAIYYHAHSGQASPSVATVSTKPKTVLELFKTDFPNLMKNRVETTATHPDGTTDVIQSQIYFDIQAKSEFYSFYIPITPRAYGIMAGLAATYKKPISDLKKGLTVVARDPADSSATSIGDLTFSGRIYLYFDQEFSVEQLGSLEALYKQQNISVQFRGTPYAMTRWLQDQKR